MREILIEQVDPADVLIDAQFLRAQGHLALPPGNDVEQQARNCQTCFGGQGEPRAHEPLGTRSGFGGASGRA